MLIPSQKSKCIGSIALKLLKENILDFTARDKIGLFCTAHPDNKASIKSSINEGALPMKDLDGKPIENISKYGSLRSCL